jgi:hypothetical protein
MICICRNCRAVISCGARAASRTGSGVASGPRARAAWSQLVAGSSERAWMRPPGCLKLSGSCWNSLWDMGERYRDTRQESSVCSTDMLARRTPCLAAAADERSGQRMRVRQAGFEPATRCLEGSRSIRLSYWRSVTIVHAKDHVLATRGSQCKAARCYWP